MARSLPKLALLGLCCIALAACDEARRSLGLTRTTPDEFQVVARAPLTLPPDYGLRPPQPGAARPQELTSREQAAQNVFRPQDLTDSGNVRAGTARPSVPSGRITRASTGETAFLVDAGAGASDPDIRALIDRESTELYLSEESFVDFLVFWKEDEPPGTIVDPQAEIARIQANAALGEDITAGETPLIERRRTAPLEGLFN